MKYLLVTALALFFSVSAAAQDKKFEYQDECGDPSMESVAFSVLTGKVTKIIDGDSIVVKLSDGKIKTIDLTGVSASTNEAAAKAFLTDTLLKKNVELATSFGLAMKDKRGWAVVSFNDQVINRLMLERGIAAYKTPAPYEYSTYGNCIYRKLEEKAKQEKLGIWAK